MQSSLPQPRANENKYRYVLYNNVESTFFSSSKLAPDTLCWVLKSKGTKGVSGNRAELFMRARVVLDQGERVQIRYPKGSLYKVRRCNVIPVLAEATGIILVVPETPLYRRAAVVHTCFGDSFLEIGCDFGPTVDRVRKALTEVPAVPLAGEKPGQCDGRPRCLGIDKSEESIAIAKERFPDCTFSVEDALTPEGTRQLWALCKKTIGCPSVVAVDINGNRELPAVLQCLDNILNPNDTGNDWRLPRLIIVKSRTLHAEIEEQRR